MIQLSIFSADVLNQLHKLEQKKIKKLIYNFIRKNKTRLNILVFII